MNCDDNEQLRLVDYGQYEIVFVATIHSRVHTFEYAVSLEVYILLTQGSHILYI